MNSKQIRWLVTTAILLALMAAFQYLRFILGATTVTTYIIGTLVNICLIVATFTVGVTGALTLSVLAPVIAWAQGFAQLPLMPWIIAGNAVLVILYALLLKGENIKNAQKWIRWILIGIVSACVKWVVISLGVTVMMGKGFAVALTVVQLQQLVTALIAMIVARLVLFALPRSVLQK